MGGAIAMKRVPRALAPAARVLACAAVIALFALSASAQNQITLELNKLEDRDGSCRAYLVFGNSGERFDAFVLDLIVFDRDQLIAKHLAVNVAPLPGLVFCPPSDQGEVIAALAISFSVWQCAGHGDAAGLGFVH